MISRCLFECALAVLEVAGLDARLRVFNRLGERLVFNRRILVEVEALHQVRDALAAKQAQQIVFKREVEARLARVALTAGTAAQLVVDTAGIVALRADDEQAPCLADLVRLTADLLAVLFKGLGEHVARVEDLLVVGLGVAGRLGDELVAETRLAQIGLCHVLGVAAEHDIGTTAGHVRRDRDCAELTGLRDDLGFLFVVLRV